VAAKKRRSSQGKGPRQGISGNPQRRAEQLAQRRSAIAEEPNLSSLRDLAYAMVGGSKPSPWWAESHQRILAAARALTWPSRLVELETQTSRIVGDEFYERLNSESSGMHSSQWLRALAEETGAELRASVAAGTGDWPQLWALLCGLALTVPPGDPQSETAKLSRETFPDIKDPYETVPAEAAQAAKLLADRGLTAGVEHPADGARPAGNPLIACDAYGSRYLLVAPFGYDGEEVDHWYSLGHRLVLAPHRRRSRGVRVGAGRAVRMAARRRTRRRGGTVASRARHVRPPAGPLPGDRADVGHAGGRRAPGTDPRVLPPPAPRPRPRPLRRRPGHRGLV
jgi:hypothetical protein